MTNQTGHLHLVCGYICAGKTTLCKSLSEQPNSVLLSEDNWLSALFGPEMKTVADYVKYSARLQSILAPHISQLLANGNNVVLDFPSNTAKQRQWAQDLIAQAKCPHTLHLLDVPLEVCKARLTVRNASGNHPFSVSEDQFEQVCAHFAPPQPSEGFNIQTHTA